MKYKRKEVSLNGSNFTELHCPYKHNNGLICLANNYIVGGDYYLWNPSINRLVLLPYPNIRQKSHGQFTFSLGFGYHARVGPTCQRDKDLYARLT